jgi:hypothetical protein
VSHTSGLKDKKTRGQTTYILYSHMHRLPGGQADMQTGRQTEKQTGRQADSQKNGQTGRQTDKHAGLPKDR